MSSPNYIKILFSFMSLFMILLGSLMNNFEKYLPCFIRQTFRYGKFAFKTKKPGALRPIEVPKWWFRHFYIYSTLLTSATMMLMVYVFIFNQQVPELWFKVWKAVGGPSVKPMTSSAAALLAMSLLMLQCYRRLYDTHFVSVYAKSGRINLSHYLVGYIHYTGCVVAILMEVPRFCMFPRNWYKHFELNWHSLTYLDAFATALFLWAWWHQYKVAVILANLRKDKEGVVVTQDHKLPHGDWFEYVSTPQNLTEILMYFALTVILRENITWMYIFAWVLTNQVETALLSHWWYQATFPDLPKQRRAIIPFLY